MKSDFSVYEIKRLLKKFEKQNRVKTIIMVGVGVAFIAAAIVLVVSKIRKSDKPLPYDGIDYEDWDELEDPDYEDYDFDDYDDMEYVPEFDDDEASEDEE